MKKFWAGGLGVIATVVAILGSGASAADNEYNGQTFEQASQSISSWGGTAKIASREGSYLPTGECVVVGSKTSRFKDSSGNTNSPNTILLNLNCNDTSALNGHPGNSVTSEQGKKILKARDWAKKMSENYAQLTAKGETPQCGAEQKYIDWCTQICKESDSCSAELQEYLGL